jgi:aromatic ring-opening dioxygenase LigB subunit
VEDGSRAVLTDRIEQSILMIRGHKVLLDSDLAALYGVSVKRLNEQVKRNPARFPPDFAFQLTREEYEILRSQFATLRLGHGKHRKYTPNVFMEHGALMAASVLNSPEAAAIGLLVVRTFVRLRQLLAANRVLADRLEALEKDCDAKFRVVFDAIRQLMAPPSGEKRPIGFQVDRKEKQA